MAAPTTTSRVVPSAIKLKDGFKTTLTPKRNPDIKFYEKQVTPPGLDFGDPIDTTTMLNVEWRTKWASALKDMSPVEAKVGYDPAVYEEIEEVGGINDEWTIRLSDGSTIAFWGILTKFMPDALVEKTFPEASITIVPTNEDNDGAEQGPVFSFVAGT